MARLIRFIGIAGGILVLASAQKASAVIADTIEFTTPFPFTVGSATVPAGSYTIKPDDDDQKILQLSGAKVSVFFGTADKQARETPSKSEVVFKRYGDGYVLKDIWIEGSSSGAESVAAEAERHLARRESKGEQRVSARKKSNTSKTY